MPDSLAKLAQDILLDQRPVLLLDTCAILDIIRVPIRRAKSDLLGASQKLLARAGSSPRRLWILVNEQVVQEWDDNAANVTGEVEAVIARTEDAARGLVASAQGLAPNQRVSSFSLGGLKLDQLLLARSESLLKIASIIADDDTCHQRAVDRMRQRVAPSSQGKQEYKDCHIIEHFLELARGLRRGGFAESIIFASSNTSDYGSVPGKPPLDGEFNSVSLQFVTDIAWAESLLKPQK
jgi:hypothetical protein